MTEIKRTMIASLLIEQATELKSKRPSELGFEDLVDVVQAVVKNCFIPNVSTRTFRFSGTHRGEKFVKEIQARDRESAIADFEITYPYLTWRTIAELN